MRRIEEMIESKNLGNIRVDYIVRFYEESRTEECHGFHTFYDTEEIDKRIESVFIVLDNIEIDITSRLRKDELSEILSSLE